MNVEALPPLQKDNVSQNGVAFKLECARMKRSLTLKGMVGYVHFLPIELLEILNLPAELFSMNCDGRNIVPLNKFKNIYLA